MPNITTNHAIICLYYYPQKVCNFHMQVFQINLKYHCSKPIKLQTFLMKQYNVENKSFHAVFVPLLRSYQILIVPPSSKLSSHVVFLSHIPLQLTSVSPQFIHSSQYNVFLLPITIFPFTAGSSPSPHTNTGSILSSPLVLFPVVNGYQLLTLANK